MVRKFKGVLSLDVDAQNTFTNKCPEELPVEGGEDIVPELNAQAQYAEFRAGSKDAHSLSSLWIDTDKEPQYTPIKGYENMDIRWRPHGVPGTAGFKLIEGLPPVTAYDYFVWKGVETDMHPYGVCFHDLKNKMSTGIIEWAKLNGVHTIIVGGLATDYCVATTVRQLREENFNVVLNKAACRGIWAPKEAGGVTPDELYQEFEDLDVIIAEDASELDQILDWLEAHEDLKLESYE